MSSLRGDVKALLSQYNEAYLRIHGETILEEAITFARNRLTSVISDLKPPLSMAVSLALETSLCRRMRSCCQENTSPSTKRTQHEMMPY
ncbi:hypothetical protein MUK42_35301 [Musa troglodytarum]|nr:hypothetical protein MUK42_35301 [Musa troglodytarum]